MTEHWEPPADWSLDCDHWPTPISSSKKETEVSNAESDIETNGIYVNPVLIDNADVEPEYMQDTAGKYMFAPASVVTIFGESGTRKSFLLQTAVADHCGIMVQLESSAKGVRKRLIKMKYPETSTGRYVFPETRAEVLTYVNLWLEIPPTIIGFDSFAPLMGLWSGDTNQDQDVQKLFTEVFHPLRNAGHCVVFLDHVPKNTKNPGFAIGSQNKKAQVDLALKVETDKKGGHHLYVTKDRENIYEGRGIDYSGFYGFLELSEHPLRAVIRQFDIEGIKIDNQTSGGIVPSSMDRKKRLLEVLAQDGPMGKEELRSAVGGNSSLFSRLLDDLSKQGHVHLGKGKTKKGTTAKVLVSLITSEVEA